jgi:hypothetical protein
MVERNQPTDPTATEAVEADQAAASFQHRPDSQVLSDLAIEHPRHVDVLYLESAPGGLHTNEHSAIDRKA